MVHRYGEQAAAQAGGIKDKKFEFFIQKALQKRHRVSGKKANRLRPRVFDSDDDGHSDHSDGADAAGLLNGGDDGTPRVPLLDVAELLSARSDAVELC